MEKQVTIVTVPLVCYHAQLYWCLYTEHTGRIRSELLKRPTGGKQVPFAFEKALNATGDILIVVDDKFNFERDRNLNMPLESQVKELMQKNPLPQTWLKALYEHDALARMVVPPKRFACTHYSFSENLLLAHSKADQGLPGECATEWALLLGHLEREGYDAVHAYVPKVCAPGICYATPYAQEAGIWTKPIRIEFTQKETVSFEYKTTQ